MAIKRVLILSPHTDDAELGCGGTITKLISEGKEILWVVFSTAEDSLPNNMPKTILRDEFISITKFLKLLPKNYTVFNYKVRKLDEYRQNVLENLVKIRKGFKPDLVIGPSLHDFHQDHSVVANEMIRAFKTTSSIICYELPWNHITFNTQLFIKLDKRFFEKKIEILKSYQSQIMKKREYFSSEFVEGIAKVRGTQVDAGYAESFEVIRWMI